jgi:hypothetical protein
MRERSRVLIRQPSVEPKPITNRMNTIQMDSLQRGNNLEVQALGPSQTSVLLRRTDRGMRPGVRAVDAVSRQEVAGRGLGRRGRQCIDCGQRHREVDAVVTSFGVGVEDGGEIAEGAVMILGKGTASVVGLAGERPHRRIQLAGVVPARGQQPVLFQGAGQSHHPIAETCAGECAVEHGQVATDQAQQDGVGMPSGQQVDEFVGIGGTEAERNEP